MINLILKQTSKKSSGDSSLESVYFSLQAIKRTVISWDIDIYPIGFFKVEKRNPFFQLAHSLKFSKPLYKEINKNACKGRQWQLILSIVR